MTRLLALLILTFLLWRGLTRLARMAGLGATGRPRVGDPRGQQTSSRPAGPGQDIGHGGKLVRCAHCGAHFPVSRGVSGPGGLYCSERCRGAEEPPPVA